MSGNRESEYLCLEWNNFSATLSSFFQVTQDFHDVLLLSEDEDAFPAHKLVLSACSPFFHRLLQNNASHPNTMLYLKGVCSQHLKDVLSFCYTGRVCVSETQVSQFLAVAEDLEIRGMLGRLPDEKEEAVVGSTELNITSSVVNDLGCDNYKQNEVLEESLLCGQSLKNADSISQTKEMSDDVGSEKIKNCVKTRCKTTASKRLIDTLIFQNSLEAEVPKGCTVFQHENVSTKRKWNSYIGPNGKKYYSLKKLKQALGFVDVSSDNDTPTSTKVEDEEPSKPLFSSFNILVPEVKQDEI